MPSGAWYGFSAGTTYLVLVCRPKQQLRGTMNSTADHAGTAGAPGWIASDGRDLQDASDVVRRAFEDDKRAGLHLAVRARWGALAVVGVLLMFLVPIDEVIYYQVLLGLFALVGWGQLKLGRVGQSRAELALMFCDLALMTFALVVPNPLREEAWPHAMQFRFDNFSYFYILLAGATIAYSWRTVFTVGTWTSGLWMLGVTWAAFQPVELPELTTRVQQALSGFPAMFELLDPNSMRWPSRVQEIVVFLIVAGILALGSRRANRLLVAQAALERERANLARYFSPNVVEELSQNDDPLKRVRTQDVAVMFVDIVGFTNLADRQSPEQVIRLLRDFHGRMEAEVFRHAGTLDKYLGDGLMATFGTPSPGDTDASNALRCAQAMIGVVAQWNRERSGRGEPEIRASVGVHYGSVVLGDIGANRLEFAVIGSTVNVASRLEAMTRELKVSVVVSEDTVKRARAESGENGDIISRLSEKPPQTVRGIDRAITVWTL